MSKNRAQYVCNQCGAVMSKWAGKCPQCNSWNSISEESTTATPGAGGKSKGKHITMHGIIGDTAPPPRISTRIPELDRILGGGLVPGSATLIGGDPGIGKSTLLLQMLCAMAAAGLDGAYFSGEESVEQIRMRGARLGLAGAPLALGLAASTDAADICASLRAPEPIVVAVVDSIQTMYLPSIESAPGTVAQVRASAYELIRAAKAKGAAVMIVGHVTKDGAIAGPKLLEHMVDTVLHFEGDRNHHFRILRCMKNRFGPTDEIGVFEMKSEGLIEVPNPSELFLADRQMGGCGGVGANNDVSGAVVFAGLEGTRPILLEIQALVAPTTMANPRRNVVGWDQGRLSMLAAVLEARGGIPLSGRDIFLNVAGGVRIHEPAADLAVTAALLSSIRDVPCAKNCVVFGEVGLAAETRRVAHADLRLKEAAKLGFDQAILPPLKGADIATPKGMTLHHVGDLKALIGVLDGIK